MLKTSTSIKRDNPKKRVPLILEKSSNILKINEAIARNPLREDEHNRILRKLNIHVLSNSFEAWLSFANGHVKE